MSEPIGQSKGYFETPQEFIPHESDNIKKHIEPTKFRLLKKGEIILATDELYDDGKREWVKAMYCIGKPVPDPDYTSHIKYRREVRDNIKKHVPQPICNEDLTQDGAWLVRMDANNQPCLYRTFSPPTLGAMQGLEQVACGIDDLLAIYLALDDFIYLRGE